MNKWFIRAGVLLLLCSAAVQDGMGQGRRADSEDYALSPFALVSSMSSSAVVRQSAERFVVASPGRASRQIRRAVTIFSPEARDEGRLAIYYDPTRRISRLDGEIRNAEGHLVRRLKKSDLRDESAISGSDLYTESRVRIAELFHDELPYTVIFDYSVDYDGILGWPSWYPQPDGNPVESATFELDVPAQMPIRFRPNGLQVEPSETQSSGRRILRWEVSELSERENEPLGPPALEQAGALHTAPDAFQIEGTQGSMQSWQTFGAWYHHLSDGKQSLPPEAVSLVEEIIAGAITEREKVERLYAFMQRSTRYVSVQLGIGGWQPYAAAYVFKRGYGDCKALTNYMQALLRAAGIAGFPALVASGSGVQSVLEDFPDNYFNHVVLFTPLTTDTLWLECTSRTLPAGHLGYSTEDRYALVVQPEGSFLARTPRSTAEENRQIRHARVTVSESGDARAEIRTEYAGNRQDRVRALLSNGSARDREEWLHENLRIPSFRLVSSDFTALGEPGPSIVIPIVVELPGLAARTGTRLFLAPNFAEPSPSVPAPVKERTQPVRIGYASVAVDSIRFDLPEGFDVEAMPTPSLLEVPFGRYEASLAVEADRTLVYRRMLEIRETVLPPEQYDSYREFLLQVAQADKAQVVLVRR